MIKQTWVVVPEEPNDAMIEAGNEALLDGREWGRTPSAADIYRAMIEVAPNPLNGGAVSTYDVAWIDAPGLGSDNASN